MVDSEQVLDGVVNDLQEMAKAILNLNIELLRIKHLIPKEDLPCDYCDDEERVECPGCWGQYVSCARCRGAGWVDCPACV